MAGRRMIAENVCTSKKLAKVSAGAERLWFRLLTRVDDNGNFHGGPSEVRGMCLPCFDVTLAETEAWLAELDNVRGQDAEDPYGLIAFYEVRGERYIHFIGFEKHQKLRSDRSMSVKFPLHPEAMVLGEVHVPEVEAEEEQEAESGNVSSNVTTPPRVSVLRVTTGIPLVSPRYGVSKAKVSEEKLSEVNSSIQRPSSFPSAADRKQLRLLYGRMSGGKHIGGKQLDVDLDKACEKFGFDTVIKCLGKWLEARQGNPKAFTYTYPLRWFFSDDLATMAELEQAMDDDRADEERKKEHAASAKKREEAAIQASIARQVAENQKMWNNTPVRSEESIEDFLGGPDVRSNNTQPDAGSPAGELDSVGAGVREGAPADS